MRRTAVIAATTFVCAFATLSCSSERESTAPSVANLAGDWIQGARLNETALGQTHVHTGTFTFAQRGADFSGAGQQTGFCHAESGDYTGPLADGLPFSVRDGKITDAHVSFSTNLCRYEGDVSADGERITGTARCSYASGGVQFEWTGDWLADRQH